MRPELLRWGFAGLDRASAGDGASLERADRELFQLGGQVAGPDRPRGAQGPGHPPFQPGRSLQPVEGDGRPRRDELLPAVVAPTAHGAPLSAVRLVVTGQSNTAPDGGRSNGEPTPCRRASAMI